MENSKAGNRNKKLILILILIAALIVAAVYIIQTHGKGSDHDQAVTDQEELVGEPLDTPVGELIIPEAWSDQVEMEDASSEGNYVQSFYKTVGDKKVLLYELIIGENGTGYELGTLPDKDGNESKVWINISVIDKDESWSDEEYEEINTIQSGVNDLIDQIYQMDGFRKAE